MVVEHEIVTITVTNEVSSSGTSLEIKVWVQGCNNEVIPTPPVVQDEYVMLSESTNVCLTPEYWDPSLLNSFFCQDYNYGMAVKDSRE